MNYEKRLKQYLEEDVIYSEYKSGKCDMSDFDKFCIEHCKDIECLLNEIQELKEQIEVGKEQYNDLVEEKENLQEQLYYLRGGEYLNQLRFERDMLQHVVDNSEVSKVDKEFIDMTHRNTELLEENQELEKQLEEIKNEPLTNRIGRIDSIVANIYSRNRTQQKEFIEWLEDMLVSELDIFSVVRVCDVLSKYKEIIGV